MKGTVKTSGVQEGGFSVIPEDIYKVKITEVNEGFTPSGQPMPTIKLTITEGPYKDNWVWDNIIISDDPSDPGYKILGRSKHFLHVIGEPYEGDAIEFDTSKWLWKELRISVYHDQYKGKAKPKVNEHLFLTDEEGKQQQQEELPF